MRKKAIFITVKFGACTLTMGPSKEINVIKKKLIVVIPCSVRVGDLFFLKRIRFYSIEKRRTILLIQRKQLHHITTYK